MVLAITHQTPVVHPYLTRPHSQPAECPILHQTDPVQTLQCLLHATQGCHRPSPGLLASPSVVRLQNLKQIPRPENDFHPRVQYSRLAGEAARSSAASLRRRKHSYSNLCLITIGDGPPLLTHL